MFHYLVMTVGPRQGTEFVLDASRQNRIGRGLDCDVILSDPLASRVHAIVLHEDDAWWVRDASSRNGTLVNNQKIDEARLADGCVLKVGSTEFEFHESATHPSDTQGMDHTQTVIRDHNLLESEHPPAEYGLDALATRSGRRTF